MKKFFKEFKEFIDRGNAMDLAVGIIIGGAFTAIVTALTANIINPTIEVVAGGGSDALSALVVPGTNIDFGAFIGAIINFLIIALVVFILIKALNSAKKIGVKKLRGPKGEELEEEPPACPFCLEEVKAGATRCPHCAAELPVPAEPTIKAAE